MRSSDWDLTAIWILVWCAQYTGTPHASPPRLPPVFTEALLSLHQHYPANRMGFSLKPQAPETLYLGNGSEPGT